MQASRRAVEIILPWMVPSFLKRTKTPHDIRLIIGTPKMAPLNLGTLNPECLRLSSFWVQSGGVLPMGERRLRPDSAECHRGWGLGCRV